MTKAQPKKFKVIDKSICKPEVENSLGYLEQTREDFLLYATRAFAELSPGQPLEYNWHLELIAKYLMALEEGKIQKLVINLPPRHLKSILINVIWSSWLLGKYQGVKVISSSYSKALSEKHSSDTRHIMQSKWYENVFKTQIMPKHNTVTKFVTQHHSSRFATSTNSTLTGEGGDILIVDDPITPMHVNSTKQRQKSIEWFEQTLMTRLNDPKNGRMLVIMHRLHEDDLSGHLLREHDGWHHLNIPAYSEQEEWIKTSFDNKYFMLRPASSALNPGRIDYSQLQEIKRSIGTNAFMAQYLQKPVADSRSMLKSSWFNYCNISQINFEYYVQSWDCAFKTGENNDFSVCATFGVKDKKLYLCDILCEKLQYADLKNTVQRKYLEYNPRAIIIEDKAAGQVLIQDLMREYTLPIIKVRPTLDKMARFLGVLHLFEAGNIFFPEKAHFMDAFLIELMDFPNVPHDDRVDAVTQFLNWWKENERRTMQVRVL